LRHSAALPRETRLLTDDGVRLAAAHDPGGDGGRDLCCVVAHGFTGSWRRPAVRAVVGGLTAYGGVVSFDFRGHGRSGGLSTVGDLEVLDVDAAVRWARLLGYQRVASIGWSMGGAVVVRHAALLRGVDAVVSVSAVSRWYYRGTAPMRRAHWAFERRRGRAVLRHAYGTRVHATHWDQTRPEDWAEPPEDVVGRIAPTPLLVVHGDLDDYFPLDHAEALYEGAKDPKELWVEKGFGHAEAAASPDLVARIGRWVVSSTQGAR
jgi:pimeloyl-ACP methyl ester carboxylesterase